MHKFGTLISLFVITAIFFVKQAEAQISLGVGGSGNYFLGSNDDNFHLGTHARLSWFKEKWVVQTGFAYFHGVVSKVPDDIVEINPATGKVPEIVKIYNSVEGISSETYLHLQYYFSGLSDRGSGAYGLFGGGFHYYKQTYTLPYFDILRFRPETYVDGTENSIGKFTANIGCGVKYDGRHGAIFAEGRYSFLFEKDKDYGYAVQTRQYLSVSAGVRIHLMQRKTLNEKRSIGRRSRTVKKERKRIRR